MADKIHCVDRMGRQRGSTLEVITVAKLVDSIPVTARRKLETCLNKDLRGAIVTTTTTHLWMRTAGSTSTRSPLRLEDGREVAIVPEMRGMCPWLSLEVNTGRGWRNMSVAEDYAEELEELTAAPWRPEPDTIEEARL